MALQFSEETEAKIQEIVSRYPQNLEDPEKGRLAALLPVLLLAQSEFGWVSVEVMDYVAERLELNPAQVLSTATFYTMFNKQPVGKCHIQVCTTLSCAFRGGYELLEELEERLGIEVGETTTDYNYTLPEVECLASCGTPPMFQVTYSDGHIEYFENLGGEQRLNEVLKQLEDKLGTHPDTRSMH